MSSAMPGNDQRDPASGASWRFRATFAGVALLAALPFLVGEYMPLNDLPQHAAQLAIGQRWDEAVYRYREYYDVNWYTNQLVAYNLTRLFALFLPLTWAIKCVLSASVAGLALSVLTLVRAVRGDPWWALLAFPVGFSFSMYWGFYNFVVSLPIGFLLLAASARYALAPSAKRAAVVLLLANFLFFAHVLILAFIGLCCAGVIAARAVGRRAKLTGLLALASVLPTVYVWWSLVQGRAASTTETPVRIFWGLHRVQEFFSLQVGLNGEDRFGLAVGIVLLALPFAIGARPAPELWRWIPFVLTLLAFAFVPFSAIEVDLLYGRFAVFALPSLLFALEPARAPRTAGRVLAAGLVAAQLLGVALKFKRFDEEARPLNVVLAAAAPRKRVLYLPTDSGSKVTRGAPYSHFGCWYQVKSGGFVDFSFAEFFPMWYRYKPELVPPLPDEFDSHAEEFRWIEHDGRRYDYLLVRGPLVPSWFAGARVQITTLARSAEWTLLGWTDAAPVRGAD